MASVAWEWNDEFSSLGHFDDLKLQRHFKKKGNLEGETKFPFNKCIILSALNLNSVLLKSKYQDFKMQTLWLCPTMGIMQTHIWFILKLFIMIKGDHRWLQWIRMEAVMIWFEGSNIALIRRQLLQWKQRTRHIL